MPSIVATIRAAMATAIATKKAANGYAINAFAIEETWFPYQQLETANEDGKVYLIGLAADEGDAMSRTNLCQKLVPVQVGFQIPCSPLDFANQEIYTLLEEQLRNTCRKEVSVENYRWNRTESLKDENGVPFSFMGLRTGFFESYFTVYWHHILA